MSKKQRHLFQDITLVVISITFAVFIVKTGVVHEFVDQFSKWQLLGVFLAGIFFTSMFTTVPSIVVLGILAETTSLPMLAIVGGLGAMVGDYIIFYFIKNRISDDIKYIISFSGRHRFPAIFNTRLFKFFVPFVGALIIASPFPDEIGITMLGLSKLKSRTFFWVSFIFNGIGIYTIGWLAKIVVGI